MQSARPDRAPLTQTGSTGAVRERRRRHRASFRWVTARIVRMLLKLRLDILVPSLNARMCLWLRHGVGRALARNAVVLFSVALLFSIGLSVETWVSTWCARVSLPSQTAERWIHARPNTTLQAREDGDSA